MSDPTRIELKNDPLTQRLSGRAIYGNTPFDVPYISHIVGNLYTGGCTNGLTLPSNIQNVISLYPWEEYTVRHELKSLTQVRFYDAEPEEIMLKGLASWAASCVYDGPTLIHCQAGLNRSGLLAALALKKSGEYSSKEAIALLREKRSPAVLCNPHFEAFLLNG